jgi:hypothetical protein
VKILGVKNKKQNILKKKERLNEKKMQIKKFQQS